jgi:hypothetical protein
MWSAVAVVIDVLHALLMAAWVVGLPLLFWHRWPRVTRAYCVYAIAFIVVSQTSYALLGECFFTTLARACALRAPDATAVSEEWFTVRLAQAIFRMTPSHRGIKLVSEALVLLSALGMLRSLGHLRRRASALRPGATGARP